jgi:hypothetical protein
VSQYVFMAIQGMPGEPASIPLTDGIIIPELSLPYPSTRIDGFTTNEAFPFEYDITPEPPADHMIAMILRRRRLSFQLVIGGSVGVSKSLVLTRKMGGGANLTDENEILTEPVAKWDGGEATGAPPGAQLSVSATVFFGGVVVWNAENNRWYPAFDLFVSVVGTTPGTEYSYQVYSDPPPSGDPSVGGTGLLDHLPFGITGVAQGGILITSVSVSLGLDIGANFFEHRDRNGQNPKWHPDSGTVVESHRILRPM